MDTPAKPNNKILGEKSLAKFVYVPEEHEHGLLPPPAYCNKFVRLRRIDYQLPFDLWWLHTHSQLPGRDITPSWNYKKIRTSKSLSHWLVSSATVDQSRPNVLSHSLVLDVYYDVKPQITGTYEAQACNCVIPQNSKQRGCGEDCINRMVFSECSPHLCPCKDKCSNQRIQKHEFAPGLEKFMTKDKV